MYLVPIPPNLRRFIRLAPVIALSASLAAFEAGCASDQPEVSKAPTSSASVQGSDITRIPQQTQSNVLNFPTGQSGSSVLQVEELTPREVRAGTPYTYQVRIINLTDQPLQNVVLRATQPAGFHVANASNDGPATQPSADGWVTYNVGALAPHDTHVFNITGTAGKAGTISQTYKVSYDQQMATAVKVTAPALTLTKQGPSDVDVCQSIDWTYSVQNTGTGVARHVTLHDQLPEGLATQDGQNVVGADLGDIPQGQSRQVVAHLKAAHSGTFASAASADSDAGPAKSQTVTTIARQPKLAVAIKGPGREYLGKQVTYAITVTNSGDTAAQKAMLHFNAPGSAKLVNVLAADGGANDAQNLGTIEAGRSRTVNATFMPAQGGTMKVEAVADAPCAPRATAATETNIMTLPALLLEAVDVQDPVRVGDNVVYRIKVTNQGNGPDTNVKVTATLPAAEQFLKATGSTESTMSGQTINFGVIPTLAPKQSATWEVTAKAAHPGDVQFKVTASSDSVKAPAEKIEPTKLY